MGSSNSDYILQLMKKYVIENFKTLVYALFIAIVIRSLFFQPFYIPSSSMEPNLLVGDRLFVSKYTYGYSRHSFPFSPNIINKRIFPNKPARGDVMVFKTPEDNRTDFIKRLIGLPGDQIQFVNGDIFLNNQKIIRDEIKKRYTINCGNEILSIKTYIETLPNGVSYTAVYRENGTLLNTDKYLVPDNHYFFMGDNRDCSRDSRFLTSVGYVNFVNIVGKAQITFLSNDVKVGQLWKFWKWNNSIRFNRSFKKIK
jgi:signal peptidase I